MVREGVEARLAVIGAHSARSDPAEGQIGHREVQDGVVQRDAAGRGVRDDVVEHVVALAERVERQRLLAVVDEPDRLVDVADREHRQDRPEDLVVHHGRIGLDAGEHRRSEIPAVAVAVATDDGGVVTAGVEQRRQPIVVTFVDDPCVVG